jgi:outer membrane protein assembly factor BamA
MKAFVAVLAVLWAAPASGQSDERIAEIRVHGNHTTPAADVLAVSGLAVGEPATPARLQDAEQQLRVSNRFDDVEVRRRYQSIADPAAILVVIVVDEHEGVSAGSPLPGPLRRFRLATMWIPVLSYADGYGFTYGARFSFVEPIGPRSRISVPLTWGGERRAAMEVARTFERGPFTSVSGTLAAYRRVNPHFDIPDVRLDARARVERVLVPWLRAGATARTARVEFAGVQSRHTAAGADVVIDTRLDPSFPRDAVHVVLGWERLGFDGESAGRLQGDIKGYVGLIGSNVVALRGQFVHSSRAVPQSEWPLLGGAGSLRGYRTGHRAGDSMAALSAEIRVPLLSPLNIGRFGAKAFVDAGATWSSSERLPDTVFDRGIGAGVYAGVAAFMLNVDVAWPEVGKPRVHVGLGVAF